MKWKQKIGPGSTLIYILELSVGMIPGLRTEIFVDRNNVVNGGAAAAWVLHWRCDHQQQHYNNYYINVNVVINTNIRIISISLSTFTCLFAISYQVTSS